MESSFSLADGYRELLFGQWMPHILFGQYEEDRLPLVDQLWDIPESPAEYSKSDSILLTRWQALADSIEEIQEWIPPFYHLGEQYPEPFHPICRFYTTLLWCENRMILQVLQQWQEELELTILKYELVTLQNQMVDYLQECTTRISDSEMNSVEPIERLAQYLNSLTRNSIIILLLEINERFSHLLENRKLSVEEIFIRHLRVPLPPQTTWFPTVDRVKWQLERINNNADTGTRIKKLLEQTVRDFSEQDGLDQRKTFFDSLHILENAWFCWWVFSGSERSNGAFDMSQPVNHKGLIVKWKQLLLGQTAPSVESGEGDQVIFNKIVSGLAEIINTLETEREPFSDAAELALLVRDLFSEEVETTHSSLTFPKNNSKADSEDHWLLNQYIPLKSIQQKLQVTSRTMRTYISDYNLPISEITKKNKWVRADDFEAFMDRFKKKGTS